MDTIFLGTTGELNLSNISWVIVIQSVVYIFVNGLIVRQIFRPIDNFIQNNGNLEKLHNRISRLALLSCIWIVLLGFLYSAINFTMILFEFPEIVETFFLKVYWGIGLIFFYCIFPGFYIYFLSTNFTMQLKLYF